MQHKVNTLSLSIGSFLEKVVQKEQKAFSLAEMLLVLLIMSFIAISLPMIHFKKSELKTKRTPHGRYECFYDAAGNLMQYSVNEEGAKNGPVGVTECRFTPPKNAIYFLVHAVGGGGGASTASGSGSVSTGTTEGAGVTYTASQINDFPAWAKNAVAAGYLSYAGDTLDPPYEVIKTGARATINYGMAGGAGNTRSMFFPNLTNVQLVMKPGKGGNLGQAGNNTIVEFYALDRDNSNTAISKLATIEAEGGTGGSGSGQLPLWLDGDFSLCDIKDLPGRKFNEAAFDSSIEMDHDTKMESAMEEALAGSGGAGAYFNPSPSAVTYKITGYHNGSKVTNVVPSDVVKKPTCDYPTLCDNQAVGSSHQNNCPAEAGRNGAVVILW